MFTLAQGLYNQFTVKPEYNVIVVGLDNAGKSTFVEHAKNICVVNNHAKKDLTKITPTVGLNLGKIDRYELILNLWDLGGQSGLRSLWQNYLSECHAIVFVIDANDIARFDEVKEAFDSLTKSRDLSSIPVLVIFNKHEICDIASAEDLKKSFQAADLEDMAVFYTSAVDGTNVERCIIWLEQTLRGREPFQS
uniref:ADP-ribosylation factor-related protein 1 n=1 Tax=Rhabditophanes sp. KR3021 TaxID=114890 RepID=A0AC35TNR3_9BILA